MFQKYSEPYIVSFAIDENCKKLPNINFGFMPFPKVSKGGTVTMLGDGHIVYGPKNPGEFVALSILFMESDRDMRTIGKQMEEVIKSKAVDLGIKAVVASNPGSAAILGILKELTQLIAGFLKNNKDDELYRIEGTFLRDHSVPYHVNRSYEIGNDFVTLNMNILPLSISNGQGPEPKSIEL